VKAPPAGFPGNYDVVWGLPVGGESPGPCPAPAPGWAKMAARYLVHEFQDMKVDVVSDRSNCAIG
jgi:hypothetical protein